MAEATDQRRSLTASSSIVMNGPLLANWKFLISHSGDDYARPRVHDHGNRVSNYQWSISGFNSKKPDACNTFTAADVRVN